MTIITYEDGSSYNGDLLDGILDHTEKADLERLRKEFGMTKRRADALINQVQSMRAKK